jgi:hypothetical protein
MGADGRRVRRGADRHHHRPPRLGLVAPALDDELLVADPDPRAILQRRTALDAPAVQPRAVARAGVLEEDLAASDRDPRLAPRHRRVVEPKRAERVPPDGDVAQQRNPSVVGQHELQRPARIGLS